MSYYYYYYYYELRFFLLKWIFLIEMNRSLWNEMTCKQLLIVSFVINKRLLLLLYYYYYLLILLLYYFIIIIIIIIVIDFVSVVVIIDIVIRELGWPRFWDEDDYEYKIFSVLGYFSRVNQRHFGVKTW